MSIERQTSDCVIDEDQDTPLLQADQDEDDEVMLDIRPTVCQPIVNIYIDPDKERATCIMIKGPFRHPIWLKYKNYFSPICSY